MYAGQDKASATPKKVLLVTRDTAFAQSAAAAFGNDPRIELLVAADGLVSAEPKVRTDRIAAAIVDYDTADAEETAAFERLARRLDHAVPIIAIPSAFDLTLARRYLKMRVGDFLIRPVATADLVRSVGRALAGAGDGEPVHSHIYTFMPAAGGVGVTTLAVATAFILGTDEGRDPSSVCLVDLNFQNGACADFIDVAPSLNLDEIEQRPERLDRQLLEVMLSHHESGIALLAAPNAPSEMRSFDPEMVTRLLDLASAYFDVVIIDLPRTWFSWTDNVLIGSDDLFIVSEMTVPGLRQTQRLIGAINERVPEQVAPKVIINRFEQRLFDSGLRETDVGKALGPSLCGTIPNNYRLVREAIDRGVPLDAVRKGNDVSTSLRTILGSGGRESASAGSGLGSIGRRLFRRGAA